ACGLTHGGEPGLKTANCTPERSFFSTRTVSVVIDNCTPVKTTFFVVVPKHGGGAVATKWHVVELGKSGAIELSVPRSAKCVGVFGQRFDDSTEEILAMRLSNLDHGQPNGDWFFEAGEAEPTVWWPLQEDSAASR